MDEQTDKLSYRAYIQWILREGVKARVKSIKWF